MTQEQKIKEILERFKLLYNQYLNECDVYDGANFYGNEKVKQCITDLTSLDNWISVESPPKKHDWYLCWSNGTERYYGFDGSWYHVSAGGSCRVNPTHYKEKSQPPKQSTKKRGGCNP